MRAKRKQISADKKGTRVIADVKLGLASPAQKVAWRKFWQKLIYEVKAGER